MIAWSYYSLNALVHSGILSLSFLHVLSIPHTHTTFFKAHKIRVNIIYSAIRLMFHSNWVILRLFNYTLAAKQGLGYQLPHRTVMRTKGDNAQKHLAWDWSHSKDWISTRTRIMANLMKIIFYYFPLSLQHIVCSFCSDKVIPSKPDNHHYETRINEFIL